MTMTIHENNLRLRHEAIERGPSMRRLYSEACDHCGAWSEDMRVHPSCTECMAMICKACIVPATFEEPDEGDWGKGVCKRCARFGKVTRTKLTHLEPQYIAPSGWHLISCVLWFTEQPSYSCGGWVELGASFAECAA